MRNLWMIGLAAAALIAPVALSGQFGYTFDCDGAARNAAGDPFEFLLSRHQVPNSADVLYFIRVILPNTDTIIEERLFNGTDNFIPWAESDLIVNQDFHANASTATVQLVFDGAQTGKSVSGHGEVIIEGRAYTFVAWPKTSIQ